MKKILLALLAVGMIAAAPVTNAGSVSKDNGLVYINTSSIADNAIDTVYVDIRDADWYGDWDASSTTLEALLGNRMLATADSVEIGIDVGFPPASDDDTAWGKAGTDELSKGAWIQTHALSTDNGTAVIGAEAKALEFTTFGHFLRFRIKNVTSGTQTCHVMFAYPVK